MKAKEVRVDSKYLYRKYLHIFLATKQRYTFVYRNQFQSKVDLAFQTNNPWRDCYLLISPRKYM